MKLHDEKEMTIEEFFLLCEQEEGQYQIDTPDGWQEIQSLVRKKNKECYNLITEDGIELGCSNDHMVLTKEGWKKAEDINVENDLVETANGFKAVIAKEYIGNHNTFDLSVNHKNQRYYSNNIISHNTGKSLCAKALASLYEMPLLRLDFGRLFGSFVGDSERNAREAIKLAEAIAPCVTGDTIVSVSLGGDVSRRYKISDLFDSMKIGLFNYWDDNGDYLERLTDGTEIARAASDIKINAYDIENGKLIRTNLKAIIRRPKISRKIFKVVTDNNKSIEVTGNHNFFVRNNEEDKWKKAEELDGEKDYLLEYIDGNFFPRKIKNIEETQEIKFVYDPSCESPHNYLAEGFINHNCILWIDEVEKGLAGAKSSGQTDGGTTSRVVGSFLTWMQEKVKPVFVFCTANDYEQIQPAFMRRFDEVFFVDLPILTERKQIFGVLLKRYKRDPKDFDLDCLSQSSDKYSGAEIEKIIKEALYEGMSDNYRKITTTDLLKVMEPFIPLAKSREEEIEELRSWAATKCRRANCVEVEKITTRKKASLDL